MKKIYLFLTSLVLLYAAPSFAQDTIFSTTNPEALSQFIASHSMLTYLGVFFLLGIGLAFTPCVLPMVPILSGIIVKERPEKSLRLSVSYVMGMAITYALAGMGAALAGQSLQVLMQNSAIIAVFSLVFVVFALDLLGIITLKLPQGSMHKLQAKGSYAKTFAMGVLSTLIVSPCVTAPLLGVLGFIAAKQEVLLGGLILFVLSLGMGLPLLLLGAGQGKLLPKTGKWMNNIKHLFGFMMLALAVSLINRILPTHFHMLSWAILLAFVSVSLFYHHQTARLKALVLSVPLALGSGYLAVTSFAVARQPVVHSSPFQMVSGLNQINQKLAQAKAKHQKVFLEFYASWCSDCTDMDSKVFSQHEVQDAMKHYQSIRVDISENNAMTQAIKKAFGVYGTPFMLFYDENGKQHKELTAAGFIPENKMLSLLKKL